MHQFKVYLGLTVDFYGLEFERQTTDSATRNDSQLQNAGNLELNSVSQF